MGSGAFFFDKSDLSSELYRVEAKRTDNVKKITIEQTWIDQLLFENAADTRVPFLAIEFNDIHYGFIKKAHYVELEKEIGTYTEGSFAELGPIGPKKLQKSFTLNTKSLAVLDKEYPVEPVLLVEFNQVTYGIVHIEYLQKLQTRYLRYKRVVDG